MFRPALIFIVLGLPVGHSLADKVTLKNGRVQEGTIESEDDKQVVLLLASGKITLMKTMIASIERDAAGGGAGGSASGADALLKGHEIPQSFKSSVDSFQDLCKKREQMVAIDVEHVRLETKLRTAAGELKKLDKADAENARRVNRAAKKGPDVYNKLVLEANAVRDRLNEKRAEIIELQKARREKMPAVMDYLIGLRQLEVELKTLPFAGPEQTKLMEALREGLTRLSQEVHEIVLDPSSDKDVAIVSAKLDNKATAKFLVDTSSNHVAVAQGLAKRLGINIADLPEGTGEGPEGEIKGRVMFFDTMLIGDSKLTGLDALIVEKLPRPGIEGVLGNNALGYFCVYKDPEYGRLVMKSYRAQTKAPEGAPRD